MLAVWLTSWLARCMPACMAVSVLRLLGRLPDNQQQAKDDWLAAFHKVLSTHLFASFSPYAPPLIAVFADAVLHVLRGCGLGFSAVLRNVACVAMSRASMSRASRSSHMSRCWQFFAFRRFRAQHWGLQNRHPVETSLVGLLGKVRSQPRRLDAADNPTSDAAF